MHNDEVAKQKYGRNARPQEDNNIKNQPQPSNEHQKRIGGKEFAIA